MARELVPGHQLQYLVQTPDSEAPEEGWPLLLFLHGAGERGTKIDAVRVHGPPKLREKFDQLANCVIVSPQCPRGSFWRVKALRALIDEVEAAFPVNPKRRYLTGLSMGGYGSWNMISNDPDLFAAVIPICGGADIHIPEEKRKKKGIVPEFKPDGLAKATDLPIWVFHGTADGAVPVGESERLVAQLRKAGNTHLRYTAFEGANHVEGWQWAYKDPALWDWCFAQTKTAFEPIFDGKTLDGWTAMPEKTAPAWTVSDGAIRGDGDKGVGYLTYKDHELGDFELKFQYRLPGGGRANTGINLRARKDVTGKRDFQSYHADLGHVGIGKNVLGAWDFHTPGRREHRCFRGDRLTIAADDSPTIKAITAAENGLTVEDIHKGEWNRVHVAVRGNEFRFHINGKLASTFTEHLPMEKRLLRGMLQLQLHDPGMVAEFKDIELKRLLPQ